MKNKFTNAYLEILNTMLQLLSNYATITITVPARNIEKQNKGEQQRHFLHCIFASLEESSRADEGRLFGFIYEVVGSWADAKTTKTN